MHVLCEVKIKYINHGYSLWFGSEGVARCREKRRNDCLERKNKNRDNKKFI